MTPQIADASPSMVRFDTARCEESSRGVVYTLGALNASCTTLGLAGDMCGSKAELLIHGSRSRSEERWPTCAVLGGSGALLWPPRRGEQWAPRRPQQRLAVHVRRVGRGKREHIQLARICASVKELVPKAAACVTVAVDEATQLQRAAPPAALPSAGRTVASQEPKQRSGIPRRHVHVHIVLPLQQARRTIAHRAKQRARAKSEPQVPLCAIFCKGAQQLVAAL